LEFETYRQVFGQAHRAASAASAGLDSGVIGYRFQVMMQKLSKGIDSAMQHGET
jgi:hypothetical protein